MKLADNVAALVLQLGAKYRLKQQLQLFKGILVALYFRDKVLDSDRVALVDDGVDYLVFADEIVIDAAFSYPRRFAIISTVMSATEPLLHINSLQRQELCRISPFS